MLRSATKIQNTHGNTGACGFTLIELTMAMAIIAVLTSISIPAYTGYRDKINDSQAITDILSIEVEIQRIYTETFHYPATLDDIASRLPNNRLPNDPWGRAYVYLNIVEGGPGINGQVRKDHQLNPLNSDYDLYSLGKNGVTKTQITQRDSVDDIIRARDGSFVGLASNF